MKFSKKILPLFLFLLFSAAVVLFLKSDLIKIKTVVCYYQTENQYCPPELWQETESLLIGKNWLFSSKTFISKILLSKSLYKEIKIKKTFPSKIILDFILREPVVALGAGEPDFIISDEFILVDEEGYYIKGVKKTDLPLILMEKTPSIKLGQKVSQEEISQLIAFLNQARLRLLEPTLAKIISPRTASVSLKNGIELSFSLEKEIDIQLDSLQLILERAKIEGKRVKKIDSRFDKPVVIYE